MSNSYVRVEHGRGEAVHTGLRDQAGQDHPDLSLLGAEGRRGQDPQSSRSCSFTLLCMLFVAHITQPRVRTND